MLVESIAKDPLGFQIMRFDNRKVNHTIIVSNLLADEVLKLCSKLCLILFFYSHNLFLVLLYLQAKSAEIKKEWVKELKRLILENHAAVIPQTVRSEKFCCLVYPSYVINILCEL